MDKNDASLYIKYVKTHYQHEIIGKYSMVSLRRI